MTKFFVGIESFDVGSTLFVWIEGLQPKIMVRGVFLLSQETSLPTKVLNPYFLRSSRTSYGLLFLYPFLFYCCCYYVSVDG